MLSNKFVYFISVMLCFALGCSKSSDSTGAAPTPSPSPVPKDVAQKVLKAAKMPLLNESKTLEFLDFYDLPDETCFYTITEKVTVSQLSTTAIEHTYDRLSDADRENSAECPKQPTKFVAHEVSSWGLGRYSQMKIEMIEEYIDPIEYQKIEWVQSASIVSSEEIEHKGLRTQVVEIAVLSKKGTKYTSKHYISLDSLFLARFEFSRTRTDNGNVVNYQIMNEHLGGSAN
jgi:hypothetical protein